MERKNTSKFIGTFQELIVTGDEYAEVHKVCETALEAAEHAINLRDECRYITRVTFECGKPSEYEDVTEECAQAWFDELGFNEHPDDMDLAPWLINSDAFQDFQSQYNDHHHYGDDYTQHTTHVAGIGA